MELLGQLALSIVTGAVASWVAVQLALRRFYQEKWWERKFAAYSTIMEALHKFNRIVRREQSRIRKDPKGPKQYKPTDITDCVNEIWRAIDLGELFISGEMVELLKDFNVRIQEAASVPDDELRTMVGLFKETLKRAVELARRDLQLVPWRIPRLWAAKG